MGGYSDVVMNDSHISHTSLICCFNTACIVSQYVSLRGNAPCRSLGDVRIRNPEFILKVALE